MTSALAPVSFDANKFISKQSNTPSVNDAGNSFNQILAKQVDAKRANRTEQATQRTADKVTTAKQTDKPNLETKTENANELASSTKNKEELVEEIFPNTPSPILVLAIHVDEPLQANDIGSIEEKGINSLSNVSDLVRNVSRKLTTSNASDGDELKAPTTKTGERSVFETLTEASAATKIPAKNKEETIEETFPNAPLPIITPVGDINNLLRTDDKGSAEEIDVNSIVNSDETAVTVDAQLAGALAIDTNTLRVLTAKNNVADLGNQSILPPVTTDVATLGLNELAKTNAINESIVTSQASAKDAELIEAANGSFLTALTKANQNSTSPPYSKVEVDAKTDTRNEALATTAEQKEKGLLDNAQLKFGGAQESKDLAQAANSAANNQITPSHFQTIAQQVVAHGSQEQIQQSEHLAPNVGTRAWDQAIGQKVIWLVAGGQQSAELTLNPPDLGPLQVVLKVSDDHLTADFSASQAEVREALESALPKLRQILNDAGIQLSGFSVNSQASQQQNQFTQNQSSNSLRRSANAETDSSVSSVSNVARDKVFTKVGLVDTFA